MLAANVCSNTAVEHGTIKRQISRAVRNGTNTIILFNKMSVGVTAVMRSLAAALVRFKQHGKTINVGDLVP